MAEALESSADGPVCINNHSSEIIIIPLMFKAVLSKHSSVNQACIQKFHVNCYMFA